MTRRWLPLLGPLLLLGTYVPYVALPHSTQGVAGLESTSEVPFWHTKPAQGPALAGGT